jgi:hypothetical protein
MSYSSPRISHQSSVARPSGSRATRRAANPISTMRTGLYQMGKVLGHVSAIQSGNLAQRIVRTHTGKYSSRGMSKLF